MGQVALGLRSLAFRIVVFVIMAAMLAWILGGTLWPRPVSVMQPDSVTLAGKTYRWKVTVDQVAGAVRYTLCRQDDDTWIAVPNGGPFLTAAPLTVVTTSAGTSRIESSVWSDANQVNRLTVDDAGQVQVAGVAVSIDQVAESTP